METEDEVEQERELNYMFCNCSTTQKAELPNHSNVAQAVCSNTSLVYIGLKINVSNAI